MKYLNLFLSAGLSFALTPAFGAPANNTLGDDNPNLDRCQQLFGSNNSKSFVIGVLPLQGDFFYGALTIGKPVDVDENTWETPFTEADVHYYLKKEHKYYTLGLKTESYCEVYVSEANTVNEVIELNWDGKPPMNNLTVMRLKSSVVPRTGCFLGAEPGNAEIVLMCEYPELLESTPAEEAHFQAWSHLQNLFKSKQVIESTCADITRDFVKGSKERCQKTLEELVTSFPNMPEQNNERQSFSKGQL